MATNKLKQFWKELAPNCQTRTRLMAEIYHVAGISYLHVKGVISRHR